MKLFTLTSGSDLHHNFATLYDAEQAAKTYTRFNGKPLDPEFIDADTQEIPRRLRDDQFVIICADAPQRDEVIKAVFGSAYIQWVKQRFGFTSSLLMQEFA